MSNNRWFKGDNVLVIRNGTANSLKLINIETGKFCILDSHHAEFWKTWNNNLYSEIEKELFEDLISKGFIVDKFNNTEIPQWEFGKIAPKITSNNVRWYFESDDLCVLYKPSIKPKETQFLILGPYGSMCWMKIIEGKSIQQICHDVQEVFSDYEKVFSFLRRLSRLGFIDEIHEIDSESPLSSSEVKEFTIGELISHANHVKVPWLCSWEICSACNLRCKHCYLSDYSNIGLNTDSLLQISQQFIDSGVFSVVIMGGEPLLRDDLERIVEKLHDGGIDVGIITNGILLTLERARSLAEAGLNMVFVSFDGFSCDMHEMIRGKGTFNNPIQAIKNAQKAGIKRIAISWAVNNKNICEFENLPDFLNSLNVVECYVETFKKTGLAGTKAPFDPISIKEVRKIKNTINNWEKQFPKLYISFNTQCLCGRNRLRIDDKGEAYLCPYLNESIGNVFNTPIIDLWHSVGSNIPAKGPVGYCRTKRELYLLYMHG